MKVLITGAGGQVAQALMSERPPGVEVKSLTRAQLDICDGGAASAWVNEFAPDVIVNAAGFTAVDKAESDPQAANGANAAGPRSLALAARDLQNRCRLIHISSDYVFDGNGNRAIRPQDKTHPLSVYGRSKLAGEEAVVEVLGERCVVLRTAWVYGAVGHNFLHTMLRLMRERGSVRVVSDQIGTPTSTPALARALWQLALQPGLSGLHHWSDAGVASWYDFAVAIAEEGAVLGLLPMGVKVSPISTEEYPTPAVRPRFAVLDKRATAKALGMEPAHWRVRLREVLGSLQGG